jgi:hypothetical protein
VHREGAAEPEPGELSRCRQDRVVGNREDQQIRGSACEDRAVPGEEPGPGDGAAERAPEGSSRPARPENCDFELVQPDRGSLSP